MSKYKYSKVKIPPTESPDPSGTFSHGMKSFSVDHHALVWKMPQGHRILFIPHIPLEKIKEVLYLSLNHN